MQGREEGAGGADAGWVVEVVGACGAHLEHCHALRARSFAPCRSAHRVSRAGCSLDYQFRLAVAKAVGCSSLFENGRFKMQKWPDCDGENAACAFDFTVKVL